MRLSEKLHYCHYSGAGNSFLIFDDLFFTFPLGLIKKLCKAFSVDGILLLQKSQIADFKMRIFNADSSEAAMCGNGLRCLTKFAIKKFDKTEYRIETLAGIYTAYLDGEEIAVEMAPPKNIHWYITDDLHFLNTGVPHAILFVENVDQIDVENMGKKWRFDPLFSPEGANVNFVEVRENNIISIRTYERGVERETLACGTGALASAIAAAHIFKISSPIIVNVRSNDQLKISFSLDYQNLKMSGPAVCLKEGIAEFDDK